MPDDQISGVPTETSTCAVSHGERRACGCLCKTGFAVATSHDRRGLTAEAESPNKKDSMFNDFVIINSLIPRVARIIYIVCLKRHV